jgi:hypothetical protein
MRLTLQKSGLFVTGRCDLATAAAYVVEGLRLSVMPRQLKSASHHARGKRPLLGLEVDGFVLAAVGTAPLDMRQLAQYVSEQLKSRQATVQAHMRSRRVVVHVLVVLVVVVIVFELVLPRLCHRLLVLGLQHKAGGVVFAALDADNVHAAHCAARQLLGQRHLRRRAGETNRGILCHLCRHTGCGADRRGDVVAHHARRGRFLGKGTCAAGEQQLVLGFVFAGK